MPGGNDTPLAGPWMGLNRFSAPHALAPHESPDTTDAAYSNATNRNRGLLSRRGARQSVTAGAHRFMGIIPYHFPWIRGRVLAFDGNGTTAAEGADDNAGSPQAAVWSPQDAPWPPSVGPAPNVGTAFAWDRLRINSSLAPATGIGIDMPATPPAGASSVDVLSAVKTITPNLNLSNYSWILFGTDPTHAAADNILNMTIISPTGTGNTVFGQIDWQVDGVWWDNSAGSTANPDTPVNFAGQPYQYSYGPTSIDGLARGMLQAIRGHLFYNAGSDARASINPNFSIYFVSAPSGTLETVGG